MADGQATCLAPVECRRHRVDDPAGEALQQLRLWRGVEMELIGGFLVIVVMLWLGLTVCASGLCRDKQVLKDQ
ncbi:MAG: hypothetical protein HY595_06185 [Candidatus Omnitrophica bacterium]|nr:hypothetical protein [Candidatus Omnitrophota bacterium]